MEDREHHVLEIHDAEMHVDAHWFRRFAEDFLSAARAFLPPDTRFSPVPYFLACRSIELSLKCFLIAAGVERAELKRLGHDLEAALIRAEELGIETHLDVTPEERESLKNANAFYRHKEFEYFESLDMVYGPWNGLDLSALISLAQRLVDATEIPARGAVFHETT